MEQFIWPNPPTTSDFKLTNITVAERAKQYKEPHEDGASYFAHMQQSHGSQKKFNNKRPLVLSSEAKDWKSRRHCFKKTDNHNDKNR